MNTLLRLLTCSALVSFAGCGSTLITHTPPGTSVELALAKKPELVRLPAPTPGPNAVAGAAPGGNVPAVEPPMPEKDAQLEKVGEAFSRGMFCLEAERDPEAIAAFEEAVKIDPTFTDAWEKLAVLYEKTGDSKKALEAFKKAKKLASVKS